MLRFSGLAAAFLAIGAGVSAPAFADVLPSRRPDEGREAGQVACRLQGVGIPRVEAAGQTAALTPGDLAYFAEGEQRVQVVAGLWLEEGLIGGAWIGLIGYFAFLIYDDAKK